MLNLINNLLVASKIKANPKAITVHPGKQKAIYGKTVEWCFEAGGKNYYKMVHDYEMPVQRFRFAKKFYEEVQNRVTHEELLKVCEKGQTMLNEGKLGETWKMLDDLKYQLSWAFEPYSLLRFASVIYFDLNENLEDYDGKYNGPKIEAFKKKEVFVYLLRKLMNGSEVLSNLSPKDLDTYLTELKQAKEKMSFTVGASKGNGSRSMKTT